MRRVMAMLCVSACAVLAACGEVHDARDGSSAEASPAAGPGVEARPFSRAQRVSGPATFAGRPRREFLLERDVYPTLDTPAAVPASEARHLADESEVLGVVVAGAARAYPVDLLALYHVVNDRLAERPVAVSYCVLCSSGVAYDARLDGATLRFGVEGAWHGVALLYERDAGSLWLHLTGECIEGVHSGRRLARLGRVRHTTWGDWRRLHADTTVLAPLAGEPSDPHEASASGVGSGSAFMPGILRPTLTHRDPRLAPSALVYGLRVGGAARAYALERLRAQPVVEERVAGLPVTVWFDAGSRSAAAFEARLDGARVHFRPAGDGRVRDLGTGSTWTMDGIAVAGPLAGRRLPFLDGRLSEWYGWAAHHPDTSLHPEASPDTP